MLIDPIHCITESGNSRWNWTGKFEGTINDVDGISSAVVVEPCDDGASSRTVCFVAFVKEHAGVIGVCVPA